jgi:hypothetical protein
MRYLVSSILFVFALTAGNPSTAAAQAVNYIDESGNIHFADSPEQVPLRYRDQVIRKKPVVLGKKEFKEAQRDFKRQQAELEREKRNEEKAAQKAARMKAKEQERLRREEEKRQKKAEARLFERRAVPTPRPRSLKDL